MNTSRMNYYYCHQNKRLYKRNCYLRNSTYGMKMLFHANLHSWFWKIKRQTKMRSCWLITLGAETSVHGSMWASGRLQKVLTYGWQLYPRLCRRSVHVRNIKMAMGWMIPWLKTPLVWHQTSKAGRESKGVLDHQAESKKGLKKI
jgi:hypothetical protein